MPTPLGRLCDMARATTRVLAGTGMLLFFCLSAAGATPTHAGQQPPSRDLKNLSLEELAQVEVSTVARKQEHAFRAPAAVYVITAEEIRRSGARNLPQALRLAPGLHVANFNNGTWGVSARGFNITTANKMQVLIDGRSLYSQLFSGVFWDVQEVMIEDIDRIEVICGPNATLWGANAVNGVINIITKKASDTQGNLVVAGGGVGERAFTEYRHGATAGPVGYRVFGRFFDRGPLALSNGDSARDNWIGGQGGLRADWNASRRDLVTVQADGYRANMGLINRTQDIEVSGGNILTHWSHRFDGGSDLQAIAYFDRSTRFVPLQFDEARNTYDVQMQHHIAASERQDLVWGFEYRDSTNHTALGFPLLFVPNGRMLRLFSVFAQDEVSVVPNRLNVTFGLQFENNTYSGWEFQPTLRVAYTPSDEQTLWGAVSRAVRTPTMFDTDLRITQGPIVLISGTPTFKPEQVLGYELGYRLRPVSSFTFDLATFWSEYDRLRSEDAPPGQPFPILLTNSMDARTYGFTVTTTYQVTPKWRATAGWTNLNELFHPGPLDQTLGRNEANDPHTLAQLRSYLDLPHNLQFDFGIRHVSRLPNGPVAGYLAGDARLGWRPRTYLDISLVGRDLGRRHQELGPAGIPEYVRPSAYAVVTWSF